jgi:SAM-dependent methyltransferase
MSIVRFLARKFRSALGTQQISDLMRKYPQDVSAALVEIENRKAAAPAPSVSTADQQPVDREGIVREAMRLVREEFTVMPRFLFHQPLDYDLSTYPPQFEPPVTVAGVSLPVPPPQERMGYSPNDATEYLATGKYDHDLIVGHIRKHLPVDSGVRLLDFGCSSGRVLRHFEEEHLRSNWELHGVDVQARPIEWLRQHFPDHFTVWTGSVMPQLPFPDASFDAIYGISVFTHIKYLWDAWLLELRRVLRPGGLLMQTVHAEPAWECYYNHKAEGWVRDNLPAEMLERSKMDVDFLYYGNAGVSQVFWKEEVARRYWSRYFTVLEFNPPPPRFSFQSWIVCRNEVPRVSATKA